MESSLADGGAAEQETGVTVDLDNPDSSKAVLRQRTRTPNPSRPPGPKDWARERADTSKEVKSRLARMTNRFNQQLADQEAAHQRQIAELRREFSGTKVKTEDTDDAVEKHQQAMDALQAKLEEAQERGDSKEVAKITREMSSLEGKFWAAQTNKQTGARQRTETPPAASTDPAARPNGGTQRQPTKAGVAWAKANADWWNDTVDDIACDARDYANRVHKRRLEEGDGDPEDPTYFEEIGDMVRKRFPEIEVKSTVRAQPRGKGPGDDDDDDDDDDSATQQRNSRPMMPNRGPPSKRQDLQTLTRADQATMRSVGMNPDNDKHVVQFLKSKREEAEAQGADA
jgi:hypothetical protein